MIIPSGAYIGYFPNCFMYFVAYIGYSPNCFVFYISSYNFIPAIPSKAKPLRRYAVWSKNGIRKESRYRCSTCEVPLCMIKQLLFLFTLKNTTLKSVELVTSFFLNFSCLRITYFFNDELLIFYRMKMECFLVLLYFLPKIYNSNICPVFDVYTRHCFILTIHPVRDVSN